MIVTSAQQDDVSRSKTGSQFSRQELASGGGNRDSGAYLPL